MTKLLRPLLFAVLSLVIASEAFGQTQQVRENPSPVRFSVAAGFNVAHLNFAFPFDEDVFNEIGGSFNEGSRFGPVAGGLVDFRVARGVSVVSGGLVSTRGGSLELTLPDIPLPPEIPNIFGTIKLDHRMIYVDVPAFAGVGVAKFGENRIEAIGGAMIGLRVHARQKFTGFGISEEQEFTDQLPAVDFGLSAGGRYTCGHIFAAAYYTWGLTDLTKGDLPDPLKHRYLTVIGGWRF